MNWQTIFFELGTYLKWREVALKVGLKSAGQAHKVAHGKQKTVTYEVGKAALDLLRVERQRKAKREAKETTPAPVE